MNNIDKYFNFIRNYNEKLRDEKTDWLDPDAMAAVIIQTARQNIQQERKENSKSTIKHYSGRELRCDNPVIE